MRRVEEDFIVESVELRGNREVRVGRFYCVLNDTWYSTLGGLRNAVKPKMTIEEFYKKFYKKHDDGKCYCGSETTFLNVVDGYSKFCSKRCSNKSEEHRKIVSARFNSATDKLMSAIEKQRHTIKSKPAHQKREEQNKRLNTLKERYGEDYMSQKTKKQWANRTSDQIKELVDKSNSTKLKNGTMEYNWFANCNKKIEIDGKVFYCQGFENQIISFLVDYGLSVNQICTGKDIPRIRFSGNKCGWHRSDIFIPDLNLIIEVKSNWTYSGKPEFLENNHAKQIAAINSGYNHMIFAIKSKITDNDKIEFTRALDMTISSQAYSLDRKVQRLSGDSEYRPIAFGSGSAKRPE